MRVRRHRPPAVKPHRSFDPVRVGTLEADAWVAYYRRDWVAFLRSMVTLVHHAFGLSWPATVHGAWLVLRANQLWAPFPDNDPDAARRAMARFYGLLRRRHGEPADPVAAAWLEVEWWRLHREHQHGEHGDHDDSGGEPGCAGPAGDDEPLIAALAALYAYVYAAPEHDVRPAAVQRALAMRFSDRWVREGRDLTSPLVDEERAALVRSFAALLAAVHRC
jgi:hypothetical protein